MGLLGAANLALSLCSAALLMFLAVSGDTPQLYSIEIGFRAQDAITVWVHPIWLVFSDWDYLVDQGWDGTAFGNVAVIKSGTEEMNFVVHHELLHAQQFRYLGPGMLSTTIRNTLNVEGRLDYETWQTIWDLRLQLPPGEIQKMIYTKRLEAMWLPPACWPYLWSFWEVALL